MRVRGDVPVTVRRIGEGFGLASVVARVDAGARSYAVKLCAAADAEAERDAYTRLLPPVDGLPVPTYVRAEAEGDAGVVVTGFVAGVQGDVLAGCDRVTALALIRSIARLHSTWWRTSPAMAVEPTVVRPLTRVQVDDCLREHGDVLGPSGTDLLHRLTEPLSGPADILATAPSTIVHGDLHLDNVIVTNDGPVVLDWAGARLGPVAVDLARCLVEFSDGAPGGDDDLTEAYTAELTTLGIAPPPELRDHVEAALLAFLPGTVRWAVRNAHVPGSREWHLFRVTLRRAVRLLAR